jgi:hypothetical protein
MKNKLALVLLVLLVAGTASLAVAQTRIECTFCHETDWTTACYKCPGCGRYTS